MSIESLSNSEQETKSNREVFAIRSFLQRAIAEFYIGDDAHDMKKMDDWLTKYSKKFAKVFDEKSQNDPTFLDRAKTSSPEFAKTVEEVAEEMGRTTLA